MKNAIALTVLALAASLPTGIALGTLEIGRMTIDGGGVMRSIGGTFELSGTIGQPDAGVLQGGSLTITGGFWFATPPGDFNEDGGTGLSDVAALLDCMGGPDGSPPSSSCRLFDVDGSGHVDLSDFAEIQRVFGGQ